MDLGKAPAWRSAVVPVPARGRARVFGAGVASVDPREQAIGAMVAWAHEGGNPVWLIEGASGAGKTALATEVADRLVAEQWPCGWARPGMGAYAVTAAARNGKHSLVLIDDAETRGDLFDVLSAATNNGQPLSVRILVLARDFGPWWHEMVDRLSPEAQAVLTAGRTVMGGGTVQPPSPQALALRTVKLGEDGPKGRAVATLAAADPATPGVLLHMAAVIVALSTRVGQLGPAELRAALRDLFEEEDGYWRRTATEVRGPGAPTPSLRSALAAAAVVGTEGLADAATVLRRVPALAVGAADRLVRLAAWWHSLYARSGDSAVPTPRLPAWLADRLPDGLDSTGISWTVAALNAERRATQTLAQLSLDAHRDVWPTRQPSQVDTDSAKVVLRREVAGDAPVDEALAWLTQELDLAADDLEALSEAISYPTDSLSRTAIVLGRRLLDGATTDEEKAALTLELGARYSEVGRWEDARELSAQAVETYRKIADYDRRHYLPDLAAAVSNLASCLAQLGRRDEALTASYEAVGLQRELVESQGDRHKPALARALTNLAACLSRSGRAPAALGAAAQAVELFTELVELHPHAYRAELAAAEHNWSVCQEAVGESE